MVIEQQINQQGTPPINEQQRNLETVQQYKDTAGLSLRLLGNVFNTNVLDESSRVALENHYIEGCENNESVLDNIDFSHANNASSNAREEYKDWLTAQGITDHYAHWKGQMGEFRKEMINKDQLSGSDRRQTILDAFDINFPKR